MNIKLQWVASAYDLRPGDVFRPELDEDCCCFEVLDYEITHERCNVRARKLSTLVEQDFTVLTSPPDQPTRLGVDNMLSSSNTRTTIDRKEPT